MWKSLVLPITGFASVAAVVVLYVGGTMLAKPIQHSVGPPPDNFPAHSVEFRSHSGHLLRGWVARGSRSGGILLLHGVRADRRSMLGRARFLIAHGYSILMIDFQAHGESEGEHITFGYLEALDAAAAVAFLRRQLPNEPIAAIGASLGGVACVLGDEPLNVEALVLEGVYPDIESAVRNRLRVRLGPLGAWFAPFLSMQLGPRFGIDQSMLRPIDTIAHVRSPLLIIAGEVDLRTTLQESRLLFEAAPNPKKLWVVPGAAHVDYYRHSPQQYEHKVLNFLENFLQRQDNYRLKQSSRPVTPLARVIGGPGTDPGYARVAPGHAAASPERQQDNLIFPVASPALVT